MDDLIVVISAPRLVEDAYTPLEHCAFINAYDSISGTWTASTGAERHDEERGGAIPEP